MNVNRPLTAVLLAGALTAPASAREPHITVELVMRGPNVYVHTDNHPAHWRTWPVRSRAHVNREDRCRWRIDARRVLRGQHLTRGVPRTCETAWTRRHVKPDPAPEAR